MSCEPALPDAPARTTLSEIPAGDRTSFENDFGKIVGGGRHRPVVVLGARCVRTRRFGAAVGGQPLLSFLNPHAQD